MPHPPIRLFAEGPAASFRFDGEPEDLQPRPVDEVRSQIHAAIQAGDSWITLDLPEPTAHPELEVILNAVREAGARTRMASNGRRLVEIRPLERLRDAGLAQLTLVFWGGSAQTHDARVGQPGAFDALMEAVELASRLARLLLTVRMVLMQDNHAETGQLVELVRQHARRFELVRLSTLTADPARLAAEGVGRRHALEAVQRALEAARVSPLQLITVGFGTWPAIPGPSDAVPQPVDGNLLELLHEHVPVPATMNGTWATPASDVSGLWFAVDSAGSLPALGLQLAAYGCPALDLPPALGGRGLVRPPGTPEDDDHPPLMRKAGVPMLLHRTFESIDTRDLPAWQALAPGSSVGVVDGLLTDNILALSTLPGLAGCLQRRGVDAHLHTIWESPANPYDNGIRLPHAVDLVQGPDGPGYADGLVEAFANTPARIAHARRSWAGFAEKLDLSPHELVLVAGYENALAILQNPTLRPSCRVVVADFHLMTGLQSWHTRYLSANAKVGDCAWWPGEHVEVHALYPRSVYAYARAGVPLRQIHWHPYPVHTGHFPPGPTPATCGTLFTGGAHQRDWKTLAEALRHLGPTGCRPIVAHAAGSLPAPLVNAGEVRLLRFYEAILRSRFVILPLTLDMRRPAGISVISMALAAGRPIIASATGATVDHLRDGHNAILVPPGQPRALAQAIDRLDHDDELLARLAAGAARSGASLSADAWARMLIEGAPKQVSFTADGHPQGPFFPWPT